MERRIAADRAGRRRRGISVDAGAARVTLGLESGALELTPGIGAAAELAKTTFEETDMARSRGGRRAPPPDLLPDIFAEEPEAATRAEPAVKSQEPAVKSQEPAVKAQEPAVKSQEPPVKAQEAPRPEALPDIAAELQRIGTQLEALKKRSAELSGGVERSAGATAGAEAAIGELRSSVDAAAKGTTQAHDNLSARLAKMEAAVGELQTLPQSAKEVAHRLEVTEKGLVGVSETIGGAERRLCDRLKPIESASASVRGATDALAATAASLNAAAQRNARVLPDGHGGSERGQEAQARGIVGVGGREQPCHHSVPDRGG